MVENSIVTRRNKVQKGSYICGVVEGFYGRPWSLDQRKHLYNRSNQLGLNTYVYAPKDDLKHRAAWRELYTEEEIAILRDLVQSAKNNDVSFVYALSPGLDIVYSSQEEMLTLKLKLEQVVATGCESFALLFDDIEVAMQEEDKKHFRTFADAHVYVTNTIFDHINAKNFYFCPTEYCETRAVPNLVFSHYLNTVGIYLREQIHVLWTGPRVISRNITVEHLKQVQIVLRRKPVIWDNLHANDYDQKRVFMGPFKGRSVDIKRHTSGLLLNPNCKYEANFVPIHTLSDWNAADADVQPGLGVSSSNTELNINRNTETTYCFETSLRNAVSTWIHDFNAPSGPNIPQIPKIDMTTEGADFAIEKQKSESGSSNGDAPSLPIEEIIQTVVAPELVDQSEEINSLTVDYAQPMEEDESLSTEECCDADMKEGEEPPVQQQPNEIKIKMCDFFRAPEFSQIASLVDICYLPFEGGLRARVLFEDFAWLLENASVMNKSDNRMETSDIIQAEWMSRYDQVCGILSNISDSFTYIAESTNKALMTELIPYAWEAHGASVVLLAVARWIMEGLSDDFVRSSDTFWEYESEDEPWTLQVGFVTESVRLLSKNENTEKLLNNKAILPLSVYTYSIRPFNHDEEEYIAELSLTTLTNNEEILRLRSKLFRDRSFKPFLLAGSEHNFLCEDVGSHTKKPLCFVACHSNGIAVQEFTQNYKEQMKLKYSTEIMEGFDMQQIVREVDTWFPKVSSDVFHNYPAWVDIHFAMDSIDAVPMKRLLQTVAVTLSINGSRGMFVTVAASEMDRQQYFQRLGFSNLGQSECQAYVILGLELNAKPAQPE